MSEEVILLALTTYAMRRAREEVDIQNAQQRSYTRSSANEDDNKVRDGKRCKQEKASRECSLGARCMILLDAAREVARLLPLHSREITRGATSTSIQFRLP